MENNINVNMDANKHQEIIIKINLEEIFHGRECHPDNHDPGTVVRYIIRVDKQQFELKEHELNGTEILKLVGLTPDTHRLFQIAEGQKEILPHESVDFRTCGIERFKSVAKHANEGMNEVAVKAASVPSRKMVDLLSDDVDYLNRMYPNWETIMDGNFGWILIHKFPIPDGYNVKEATIAFMIPSSYPVMEFDMMYFYPGLARIEKVIGALTDQPLDNKSFQRWSRHRNSGVWRSGIDNLETHVLSVIGWLEDELKK